MDRASPGSPAKGAESTPHGLSAKGQEGASAYALVKLREGQDRVEAFRSLGATAGVMVCDAVNGEHDLVLLFHAPSQHQIEEILDERVRSSPDVLSLETLPISGRALDSGARDSAVSAYVLVEVADGCVPEVVLRLRDMEQVVSCAVTDGNWQIVARVQASAVCDLDRVLNHDLGMIDGIIRTRTSKLIRMLEA